MLKLWSAIFRAKFCPITARPINPMSEDAEVIKNVIKVLVYVCGFLINDWIIQEISHEI